MCNWDRIVLSIIINHLFHLLILMCRAKLEDLLSDFVNSKKNEISDHK